jgi:hypothetical protein
MSRCRFGLCLFANHTGRKLIHPASLAVSPRRIEIGVEHYPFCQPALMLGTQGQRHSYSFLPNQHRSGPDATPAMCFDFTSKMPVERSAATFLPLTGNFLASSPSRLCVSSISHAAASVLVLALPQLDGLCTVASLFVGGRC